MPSGLSTITNLAIIDDAINVYDLSTIIEGSEDATELIYNEDGSFFNLLNNQEKIARLTCRLQGSFLGESSDESAIIALEQAQDDIQIVGYGYDSVLIFNTPNKFAFVRKSGGVVDAFTLSAQKDAVQGYNTTNGLINSGVYFGQNILALYNVLSGANGTSLYGFSITDGAGTISRTGEVVTITETSTSATVTYGSELIPFPFPTKVLTGSLDLTTAGTNNVASIAFFDDAEALISRTNFTLSGTGRKSFNATIPANTVYIAFEIIAEASEVVVFSKPKIGITTNSEFSL